MTSRMPTLPARTIFQTRWRRVSTTSRCRLLESGQFATAFGYIGVSVLGGLLAAWAGLTLARL